MVFCKPLGLYTPPPGWLFFFECYFNRETDFFNERLYGEEVRVLPGDRDSEEINVKKT